MEVAAYYVICEALANAVKHAAASGVTVHVCERWDGDDLDDGGTRGRRRGRGLDAGPCASSGSGLQGLRDRVAALGGTLGGDQPGGRGHEGPGGDPVRVAIADDSVLLREGVARLLAEAGFEVVATYGDAESLLVDFGARGRWTYRLDIKMPPTYTDEGLRAAPEIRARWPGSGAGAVAVRRAGWRCVCSPTGEGSGYLLKDRVADVESSSTPSDA